MTILDEFYNSFTDGEDSDYLTSHSLSLDCHTGKSTGEGQSVNSGISIPLEGSSGTHSSQPNSSGKGQYIIPPPPFSTPPKLKPVEEVMSDHAGSSVACLRNLTTALAKDSIVGRDDMAKKSLSGRKSTGVLKKEKLSYIKSLVKSRIPDKSQVEFEYIWTLRRNSLSKSCQTLRNASKH